MAGSLPLYGTPLDAPPAYNDAPTPRSAPPSQQLPAAGIRISCSTDEPFPSDENIKAVCGRALRQVEKPPSAHLTDLNGEPLYVASAIMIDRANLSRVLSVHPCKAAAYLRPYVRAPYGGVELLHHGRFDILPITADMEWVPASHGMLPSHLKPVEGGFEEDGKHLYHALYESDGIQALGKTAPHLRGANIPYGGGELVCEEEYSILCWKA